MKKWLIMSCIMFGMAGCADAPDVIGTEKTLPGEMDELAVMRAESNGEADVLWRAYGLTGKRPDVNFREHDLFFIGMYESGTCPYELDEVRMNVSGKELDIQLKEPEGDCTADEAPRTFYMTAPKHLETVMVNEQSVSLHEFEEEKQAAWAFLQKQGWNRIASELAMTRITDNTQHVEWVAGSVVNKELVAVSFLEKEPSVTGVPVVFVDPKTKKVVGYSPGE